MRKQTIFRRALPGCALAALLISRPSPSFASNDAESCGSRLEEDAPQTQSENEPLKSVAEAFERRVSVFIDAYQDLRRHPQLAQDDVRSAIGVLLAHAWEVRTEIVRSGLRHAQKHEARSQSFVQTSPLLARLQNHQWQDKARELEANAAKAWAFATDIANAFDDVMAQLMKLQNQLRGGLNRTEPNFRTATASTNLKRVRSRLSKEALMRQWSQATDVPGTADVQLSRHFVLGLSRDPIDGILSMMEKMTAVLAGAAVGSSGPSELLAAPERIAEKGVLNISYVGPGGRQSNEDAGFVLDVPHENILTTAFEELSHLSYAGLDDLDHALAERQILGPDELLRYSRHNNQVHVIGTHPRNGSRVRVIGVFLRVDDRDRFYVSDADVTWWLEYTVDHHLPPPVLVRDQPHGWEKTQGADLTIWLAARDLVKRGLEKSAAGWEPWADEALDVLKAQGNASLYAQVKIKEYVDVKEVAPDRFALRMTAPPPKYLRWPDDEMIRFDDLVGHGKK